MLTVFHKRTVRCMASDKNSKSSSTTNCPTVSSGVVVVSSQIKLSMQSGNSIGLNVAFQQNTAQRARYPCHVT